MIPAQVGKAKAILGMRFPNTVGLAAGLDKDYLGKPFGPMPALMASAEYVTKVHAVCVRCGSLANFSHRMSEDDSLIVLGEKNNYEPLCRECFNLAK